MTAVVVAAAPLAHALGHEVGAVLGLTRFQLYTRLKRYQIDVTYG